MLGSPNMVFNRSACDRLGPILVTDTRRSTVSWRYPKPDLLTQEKMAQRGNVAMLGVERVRAAAFTVLRPGGRNL